MQTALQCGRARSGAGGLAPPAPAPAAAAPHAGPAAAAGPAKPRPRCTPGPAPALGRQVRGAGHVTRSGARRPLADTGETGPRVHRKCGRSCLPRAEPCGRPSTPNTLKQTVCFVLFCVFFFFYKNQMSLFLNSLVWQWWRRASEVPWTPGDRPRSPGPAGDSDQAHSLDQGTPETPHLSRSVCGEGGSGAGGLLWASLPVGSGDGDAPGAGVPAPPDGSLAAQTLQADRAGPLPTPVPAPGPGPRPRRAGLR